MNMEQKNVLYNYQNLYNNLTKRIKTTLSEKDRKLLIEFDKLIITRTGNK